MSVDEPGHPAGGECWKVLLVDDEPTVHDMSRLILAGLQFEGRDVELLCANSAAQARELLSQRQDVALALVDVVMETDDAGICLVQHIRERLHDNDMQIVLRTGQPGMAPEGEIVRRYEINGYFLKTEITAQRLHSIVIAALRNYRHARSVRGAPGRNAWSAPSRESDGARIALAQELARSCDGDDVVLQAQPEVTLASNRIAGIELVPSWRTSQGLLPAARVGDVLAAGRERNVVVRWLLARACFWARTWQVGHEPPLTVSIPLAGECLDDCATLEAIIAAVSGAGLPRGTLDLLVSEATLLSGHPDVRSAVQALRNVGVTVTLTDFGAATISLQRLNQLVPDRLKIHRIFVRGVASDPGRMALARSLIALAQTLNVVAIADGIASDADAQFFKWEGCNLGQGDAVVPGCTPADVAEYLQHGKPATH